MLLKTDARFAFCIAWWSTEKEALKHAKRVEAAGDTYQGGMCSGARCGRNFGFDTRTSFAVTYDVTGPTKKEREAI